MKTHYKWNSEPECSDDSFKNKPKEDLLEDIKFDVYKKNGTTSYDTWGNKNRSTLFHFLLKEYVDKGVNLINISGSDFILSFRHGRDGRGGMDMGSPDSIYVIAVKEVQEIEQPKMSAEEFFNKEEPIHDINTIIPGHRVSKKRCIELMEKYLNLH